MRLPFLNRKREISRLKRALQSSRPAFIAVYGRRRLGKSRMLQHILTKRDIYYLADQRESALQREGLATEVSRRIPGFNRAVYPDWDSLLTALNDRASRKTTLIIDEFPYLCQMTPALPSIIQKIIDKTGLQFNLIVCGSSQKMMHSVVLDGSAPLYGRASEILKIRPLGAGWVQKALKKNTFSALESFAVWGGVPRYWELSLNHKSLKSALKDLVFDRDGLLHNEPQRLLLDDMRSAVQPHSLLAVIANGAHRLSEIAGRLNKKVMSLTRPLDTLLDLGYIKREIPFGETTKSTKRSLYKIADPFLLYWYRFVQPNKSLLEQDLVDPVMKEVEKYFSAHLAEVWENMARESTARLLLKNTQWKPAQRWWGRGKDGAQMELDIVAESQDGKSILFGEAKTGQNIHYKSVFDKLKRISNNFPLKHSKNIVLACWAAKKPRQKSCHETIIDAEQCMNALQI